jgi:hypothetical protein
MKKRSTHITLCLCLVIALLGLTACGSTRSENGVTIENKGSYNPLSYIPGL